MSSLEEDETEPTPFVTPVVKDEEGRKITRTMRRTDRLQDLTDFDYAMVPIIQHGTGVFLYRGKRVDGKRTPADYEMEDGDQVDFFLEIKPGMLVTLVLCDMENRMFSRTMRRTDPLQDGLDYHYAMVPNPMEVRIIHDVRPVSAEQTPMDPEMISDEDWIGSTLSLYNLSGL